MYLAISSGYLNADGIVIVVFLKRALVTIDNNIEKEDNPRPSKKINF